MTMQEAIADFIHGFGFFISFLVRDKEGNFPDVCYCLLLLSAMPFN